MATLQWDETAPYKTESSSKEQDEETKNTQNL
jgi:hypothetical protein